MLVLMTMMMAVKVLGWCDVFIPTLRGRGRGTRDDSCKQHKDQDKRRKEHRGREEQDMRMIPMATPSEGGRGDEGSG